MEKLKNYQIPFSGLKLGSHQFDFEIKDTFFKLFDYSELNSGNLKAKVLLHKKNTLLELVFEIKGTVTLSCDTCTDEYQQNITSSFKQIVKFSDGEETQDTDEIIVLSTNEHTLEIGHSLYEFIHLSLPSKRTHAIEADCNQEVLEKLEELAFQEPEVTDPRWSALQKLNK